MGDGASEVGWRKRTRLTEFCKNDEIMEGKKACIPDRLSELPEELLIKILSLLEMKEAVKTSALSSRWKLLWTKVDTLVYKDSLHLGTDEERKYMYQRYLSFVDRTLMKCTSSRINLFCLSLDGGRLVKHKPLQELCTKWLTFVLQKNVESLKLYLTVKGMRSPAPEFLYLSSTLVNLSIENVSLSVSSPVSWCLLRSLHLDFVELDDDSVANILLGCPVLETIVLDSFWGIEHLKVMSPSVKKLELRNPRYSDDDFLKVYAPWIKELVLGGDIFTPNFHLVDVSSLKIADLCFYDESWCSDDSDVEDDVWWNDWNQMIEELLKAVYRVDQLAISSELIQGYAVSKLMGKRVFKCKHLTVHVPLWKYDVYGIACLLQNAPYVETLFMKVVKGQRHDILQYNFDAREVEMGLSEVHLMYLKYLKIEYERNWNHSAVAEDGEECLDFEFVESILKSTSVLEKFVITASGGHCGKCLTACSSRYVPSLSSKLLAMYLVWNETLEWELLKTNSTFEFRFSNYTPLLTRTG